MGECTFGLRNQKRHTHGRDLHCTYYPCLTSHILRRSVSMALDSISGTILLSVSGAFSSMVWCIRKIAHTLCNARRRSEKLNPVDFPPHFAVLKQGPGIVNQRWRLVCQSTFSALTKDSGRCRSSSVVAPHALEGSPTTWCLNGSFATAEKRLLSVRHRHIRLQVCSSRVSSAICFVPRKEEPFPDTQLSGVPVAVASRLLR